MPINAYCAKGHSMWYVHSRKYLLTPSNEKSPSSWHEKRVKIKTETSGFVSLGSFAIGMENGGNNEHHL